MKLICNILLCCLVICLVIACGGGGSGSINAAPMNYVAVRVDKGVTGDYLNGLFTKVTICNDATNSCVEIDNILVDTGSTGLRLISSAIPRELAVNYLDSSGDSIAECTQFVSGVVWGPLANVTIKIGGETARNIPIQLAGVNGFYPPPNDCSSKGQLQNDVQTLAANGVLGISNFTNDCGLFCENNSSNSYYYKCDKNGCENIPMIEGSQVQNPVAHFDKNNNGTIISLPSISAGNALNVEGQLFFGINTQSNNQLNNAKIINLNPKTATFSTIYKNHDYSMSYFDSGSNGVYFDDKSINICTNSLYQGYYCPGKEILIDVVLMSTAQEIYGYTFNGSDASLLLRNSEFLPVQPQLIGASGGSFQDFVWGLPFFYGKNFYTAIEKTDLTRNGIFCAFN